jgi:hypothetical protein
MFKIIFGAKQVISGKNTKVNTQSFSMFWLEVEENMALSHIYLAVYNLFFYASIVFLVLSIHNFARNHQRQHRGKRRLVMKKNGYSHENRQNKSFFLGNYHRDGVCIGWSLALS